MTTVYECNLIVHLNFPCKAQSSVYRQYDGNIMAGVGFVLTSALIGCFFVT